MIPKIIHYCWLSNDPIPEELCRYMETWKTILFDYEFVLWNFDRFDINSSIWVRQAFEAKKYAYAADFIRFYAVYTQGGIYLDMDIEIIKPFDELLNMSIMMAYENKECVSIEAGCFGAEKGSVYIKKCLDYYEGRRFIKPDGSYDMITAPEIIKKVFDEADFNSLPFYTSDYFTGKDLKIKNGKILVTKNTYCIHHFVGSWLANSVQKWKKFRKKLQRKGFWHLAGSIIAFIYFFIICLADGDIQTFMIYFRNAIKKRLHIFSIKR